MAAIRRLVAMGRRMKISEKFTLAPSQYRSRADGEATTLGLRPSLAFSLEAAFAVAAFALAALAFGALALGAFTFAAAIAAASPKSTWAVRAAHLYAAAWSEAQLAF